MAFEQVKYIVESTMNKHQLNEEAIIYGEKLNRIVEYFSDDAVIQKRKQDALVIEVSSSAVLQELMMRKCEILEALKNEDSSISNITFTMRGRT